MTRHVRSTCRNDALQNHFPRRIPLWLFSVFHLCVLLNGNVSLNSHLFHFFSRKVLNSTRTPSLDSQSERDMGLYSESAPKKIIKFQIHRYLSSFIIFIFLFPLQFDSQEQLLFFEKLHAEKVNDDIKEKWHRAFRFLSIPKAEVKPREALGLCFSL